MREQSDIGLAQSTASLTIKPRISPQGGELLPVQSPGNHLNFRAGAFRAVAPPAKFRREKYLKLGIETIRPRQ